MGILGHDADSRPAEIINLGGTHTRIVGLVPVNLFGRAKKGSQPIYVKLLKEPVIPEPPVSIPSSTPSTVHQLEIPGAWGQPKPPSSPASPPPQNFGVPAQIQHVSNGALAGLPYLGDIGRLADIKPKASQGDYRSDFTVDRADVGDLIIGAVSLRGLSHQDFGKPRQDSVAYKVTQDGRFIIAAIADGMSAAPLSQLGADRAVRLAIRHAEHLLKDYTDGHQLGSCDWASVEAAVRDDLLNYAKILEQQGLFSISGSASPMAYAKAIGTTAELVIVRCEKNMDNTHDFVRVVISGDGSGYIHDPERAWKGLSSGKTNDGELASNALVPLPVFSEGYPLVQTGSIRSGQAVVIVTDGIGDMGIGTGNAASSFLHDRLSKPLSAGELFNTFSFIERFKDDDRSAVVIWAT